MSSVKNIGKPYAGKPHVRFDEGGQPQGCSLLYPRFAIDQLGEKVATLAQEGDRITAAMDELLTRAWA